MTLNECDGSCCEHNPGFDFGMMVDDPLLMEMAQLFTVREQDGTFTCRYFDKASRLCTIYDQRPQFCRNWFCHTHDDEGDAEVICGPRETGLPERGDRNDREEDHGGENGRVSVP